MKVGSKFEKHFQAQMNAFFTKDSIKSRFNFITQVR